MMARTSRCVMERSAIRGRFGLWRFVRGWRWGCGGGLGGGGLGGGLLFECAWDGRLHWCMGYTGALALAVASASA